MTVKLGFCYLCRDEVPADELKPIPVTAAYLACKSCYKIYMQNREAEPF